MHEVIFSEQQSIPDLLTDQTNSRTMLTEFFEMNKVDPNANLYFYHEFPEHYTWDEKNNHWRQRKGHYKVIGRLTSVSPYEGERFYVRVLLLHRKGPTSFDDLKTVHSVRYNTFKEAAEHMGLLQKDNLIQQTLREACLIRMPAALRQLFVIILIYCNPVEVRTLWNEFHPYMLEDYPSTSSLTMPVRLLLNDLELSLNDFHQTISNFDLPAISDFPNEEPVVSHFVVDERSIPVPPEDLEAIEKLNNEQKHAFDMIMDAVHHKTSSVFFIDGPAGTGKTFLYRSLLAAIRHEGHIALATATSGIASIMMPGGRTAHSRFKIPIPTLPTSTCRISKQSDEGILLHETTLIIWDEATMAHRYTIEALDKTLRDLFHNDQPFGGKIVVLGGDFRQVLPVVPRGTRSQAIDACITYSSLWDHVKLFHLTQNMRARTDSLYSDMLMRIGNGSEPYVVDDLIRMPDEIVIPWEGEQSILQLINAVFPKMSDNAYDRNYIMERAIITPKNNYVDQLNHQVLQLFPGNEIIFHSFDSAENDPRNLYQLELLNSISTSQLPPHKLTVKIGCPMIVLRNLDPKNGVCNGTRVLLRGIYQNVMHAEIITGSFSGRPVFLPRIPLKTGQQDIKIPFVLIRNQFPVRLSFALTINKSQGQTIPNVGIYLPSHVFSHGQLYVALSRGISRHNTKILIKNGSVNGFSGVHTRNVVFHEVLQPHE
ncbi:Atp-dependent dna helicase pif1 [Thalictrum thalictroides]|uniref:ATP-dependent DNA helicase n=1 Tax=Thalictrum thalictroides TaxID=46969 RepID=A0A7J6VQB5_THATH|nr:Atp-dependent dna helicase pif1 [Thalictrum thalictroides]